MRLEAEALLAPLEHLHEQVVRVRAGLRYRSPSMFVQVIENPRGEGAVGEEEGINREIFFSKINKKQLPIFLPD